MSGSRQPTTLPEAPNDGSDGGRSLFSPRRLAVQIVGFAVGLALLAWCIKAAVEKGDWTRLGEAPPHLVAGLLACSLASFFVNGAIFWITIRPVQRLRFWDLQWLNLAAGFLNYAPIRAGLIARFVYHRRFDGMGVVRIAAWLAAIAYTLLLALGACTLATIVRPRFDALWALLVAGQLLLGGALAWALMGQAAVVRHARGIDRVLREPSALAGAIVLRLVDIAAFAGRMACAAAILGLDLPASDVLLLGFAALALSLNPLGRTGFRELAVAFVASRMAAADGALDVEGDMAQLALVESAGEALVLIPAGALASLWLVRRWRRSGRAAYAVNPPPSP